MIGIIDYGMGNLRSVNNAFRHLGADARLVADPRELRDVHSVVLPGVGAFGDAMRMLHERGFPEAIEREASRGKPLLGICLGMQLLATRGTEHGEHRGLGLIPGSVTLFPPQPSDPTYRVPHIGWNDVRFVKTAGLHAGQEPSKTFYFVHSYRFEPEDPAAIAGVCDYGVPFAATLEMGNIFGAQFHPEKSQHAGLALLRNFVKIGGRPC